MFYHRFSPLQRNRSYEKATITLKTIISTKLNVLILPDNNLFPAGVSFVSKGNFKFATKTRYETVITEMPPVEYSYSTQIKF